MEDHIWDIAIQLPTNRKKFTLEGLRTSNKPLPIFRENGN